VLNSRVSALHLRSSLFSSGNAFTNLYSYYVTVDQSRVYVCKPYSSGHQ